MNSITASEQPLTVGVERAQQLTELSRTKIYELINSGRLKSKLVEGRRLIDFRSLEALVRPEAP
jgi:hypothetical protein